MKTKRAALAASLASLVLLCCVSSVPVFSDEGTSDASEYVIEPVEIPDFGKQPFTVEFSFALKGLKLTDDDWDQVKIALPGKVKDAFKGLIEFEEKLKEYEVHYADTADRALKDKDYILRMRPYLNKPGKSRITLKHRVEKDEIPLKLLAPYGVFWPEKTRVEKDIRGVGEAAVEKRSVSQSVQFNCATELQPKVNDEGSPDYDQSFRDYVSEYKDGCLHRYICKLLGKTDLAELRVGKGARRYKFEGDFVQDFPELLGEKDDEGERDPTCALEMWVFGPPDKPQLEDRRVFLSFRAMGSDEKLAREVNKKLYEALARSGILAEPTSKTEHYFEYYAKYWDDPKPGE